MLSKVMSANTHAMWSFASVGAGVEQALRQTQYGVSATLFAGPREMMVSFRQLNG